MDIKGLDRKTNTF